MNEGPKRDLRLPLVAGMEGITRMAGRSLIAGNWKCNGLRGFDLMSLTASSRCVRRIG